MDYPGKLTLLRCRSAHVRVEPPDVIVVETPDGTVRLRRSDLRACHAMDASWYRAHWNPKLQSARDDDVVIKLEGERLPREHLGPFPLIEGGAIADAIKVARDDLLFAMPELAVGISDDGASLVIHDRVMRLMVRPLTTDVVDLVPRADRPRDLYTISVKIAPPDPRWIEIVMTRGEPMLLGPLSAADTARLVMAFRVWRAAHPLDLEPLAVEERALVADPERFHVRRIVVTGIWERAFERSSFANAWLDPPSDAFNQTGTFRVRVTGTWIHPPEGQSPGYGHMGGWPGTLRADKLEILEVVFDPRAGRDGLTGLATRAAFQGAFLRERGAHGDLAFARLAIDHMKRINDAHGYPCGDDLIRAVANAVRDAVRPSDIVARWAGDEIAVLMPSTDLATARAVIARALARVRALPVPSAARALTLSGGLVALAHGEELHEAATRAGVAQHEAKKAGRDRVAVGA